MIEIDPQLLPSRQVDSLPNDRNLLSRRILPRALVAALALSTLPNPAAEAANYEIGAFDPVPVSEIIPLDYDQLMPYLAYSFNGEPTSNETLSRLEKDKRKVDASVICNNMSTKATDKAKLVSAILDIKDNPFNSVKEDANYLWVFSSPEGRVVSTSTFNGNMPRFLGLSLNTEVQNVNLSRLLSIYSISPNDSRNITKKGNGTISEDALSKSDIWVTPEASYKITFKLPNVQETNPCNNGGNYDQKFNILVSEDPKNYLKLTNQPPTAIKKIPTTTLPKLSSKKPKNSK